MALYIYLNDKSKIAYRLNVVMRQFEIIIIYILTICILLIIIKDI
jgi:hypothetical protein